MTADQGRIHPVRHSIMRLPNMDPHRDPWTGAALESGRSLTDDTPIDENMPLLPPLGKSPAQVQAELTEPIRAEDLIDDTPESSDRDWVQFTLGDMLILMTAAGIALGGVRLLPAGIFALVAGTLTAVFLMVVRDHHMSVARLRTIVIGLLTIYLIATGTAIVNAVTNGG